MRRLWVGATRFLQCDAVLGCADDVAIGATGRSVRQTVVWSGVRLCLIGVAVGSAVAYTVVRLAGTVLFEVRPSQPIPYLVAAILTLAVVGLACYVPARRASRIDVTQSLKSE